MLKYNIMREIVFKIRSFVIFELLRDLQFTPKLLRDIARVCFSLGLCKLIWFFQ